MTSKPLIIFDCDGVLVDSEPIANAVLACHLTDIGLPTTTQQCLERYKGRSMTSVMEMVEAALGKPAPDEFLDRMQADTYKVFESDLVAVDGAKDLITWSQEQGFDSCIASSGDYEKLGITLTITRLGRYFEGRIFSSVDVEHGKPAPDLFLHACAQMASQPSRSFVIEDSPAGVAAARAAGMRVFAYGDFARDEGVYPVSHLSEIKGLLPDLASAPV